MPASKKKKFIDKKNAVSFRLVNRSQRDPLAADETAPQHVLLEQVSKSIAKSGQEKQGPSVDQETVNSRKEEQRKYGVFFDDDYNYLQHLKEVGDVTLEPMGAFAYNRLEQGVGKQKKNEEEAKLALPSSVFASNVEEEVGLLNRAAPHRGPRPDLDPDIVAILDSDYEEDVDELEDDFIGIANAPQDGEVVDADETGDIDVDHDPEDCDEEDDRYYFSDEETRSRFTNYSMSSSVIHRNNGLVLLDERFEKLFEKYDEDCIGALDGDETDGFINSGNPLFEDAIEKFENERKDCELDDIRRLGTNGVIFDDETSSDEDEVVKLVIEEPDEKWDCESFLSTYSNLYNHPKLIKEPSKVRPIKVSSKTGIPVDVLRTGLTEAALKSLDPENNTTTTSSSMRSSTSKVSKRHDGETTEERRQRKHAIKEQRRERRAEKKANTLAFKEEKKKQVKIMLNLQQHMTGMKLS